MHRIRIYAGLLISLIVAWGCGPSTTSSPGQSITSSPDDAEIQATSGTTSPLPASETSLASPPATQAVRPATPQPTVIALPSATAPTVPAAGQLMIEGLPARRLIGNSRLGNTFYALTSVGLYITRNGGQNWAQTTSEPLHDNFVFSRAEPGILYTGVDVDCFRGGEDQPVYKSTNGGATWNQLANGTNLQPVAVHPDDPNRLWAIGCAGPAYSSDGGVTWAVYQDDLFQLYNVNHVFPTPQEWSIVYVSGVSEGGSGLVAQTQDGGANWRVLLQESPEHQLWWINALLMLPKGDAAQDQDSIFLIDPHGVWRSQDGGITWQTFDTGLEKVVYREGADFTTIGLYDLAIGETLDDITATATLYLGTVQGLYQSQDEGETWRPISDGPWAGLAVHELGFSPATSEAATRLFVTTDEGVYFLTP